MLSLSKICEIVKLAWLSETSTKCDKYADKYILKWRKRTLYVHMFVSRSLTSFRGHTLEINIKIQLNLKKFIQI